MNERCISNKCLGTTGFILSSNQNKIKSIPIVIRQGKCESGKTRKRAGNKCGKMAYRRVLAVLKRSKMNNNSVLSLSEDYIRLFKKLF